MSIDHPFNESAVNDAFRKVRNRLRKHYPQDVVFACINKLNQQASDFNLLVKYPPWRLLLLIKWTLLYGEYLSPTRRSLDINKFNYLVNLMHDLDGQLRMPSEYDNPFLFFRNMAFQQFWLQHELDIVRFVRQSVMFGNLDDNHPFQTKFAEICGFTLQQFLELGMMLMTRFTVEKQNSVTIE